MTEVDDESDWLVVEDPEEDDAEDDPDGQEQCVGPPPSDALSNGSFFTRQ